MKTYDEIRKDFPQYFIDSYHEPAREGFKFFFECDEGWNDIIYNLCAELKAYGWEGNVIQVKEKWGYMSLYVTGMTDEQYAMVDKATEKTKTTCEVCGEPGVLRKNGWLKTYCDKHQEEYLARIAEYKEKLK